MPLRENLLERKERSREKPAQCLLQRADTAGMQLHMMMTLFSQMLQASSACHSGTRKALDLHADEKLGLGPSWIVTFKEFDPVDHGQNTCDDGTALVRQHEIFRLTHGLQ